MDEKPKKKVNEKYCIVPMCHNTTAKTPNKLYFSVPRKENLRKKWCTAMKRDVHKSAPLSYRSTLYCCEDHFNLEEDVDNFWEFKLMGNTRARLKRNTVPHIFECQNTTVTVPIQRKKATKKGMVDEASEEVKEALSEACTSKSILLTVKNESQATEDSCIKSEVFNNVETVWLKTAEEKSIKQEFPINTNLLQVDIKEEPTDNTSLNQTNELRETIDSSCIKQEYGDSDLKLGSSDDANLIDIKDHVIKHENHDKNFLNNEGFSSSNPLIRTSEKPFQCDACNKSFAHMFNLKTHKRLHTGEKPYRCDVCDRSFSQLVTLKKHKLVHASFDCDACEESFDSVSSLNEHKLLHTGDEPDTFTDHGNDGDDELFVGKSFKSYKAWNDFLTRYSSKTKNSFWKRSSRKIANTPFIKRPLNASLEYYEIFYACVHGGQKFQSQSKGFRKSTTIRLEEPCQANIKLRASTDGQTLEIKHFSDVHNHEEDPQMDIKKPSSTKKHCIVPMCTNTSVTSPNKQFFTVPKNESRRKKWCKAMKRDEKKNAKMSNISSLYCCEDHFNFKEDLENFWEFELMDNVLGRLKKNVVPHIFTCQNTARERNIPLKRKRTKVIDEALKEIEDKTCLKQVSKEVQPSTSTSTLVAFRTPCDFEDASESTKNQNKDDDLLPKKRKTNSTEILPNNQIQKKSVNSNVVTSIRNETNDEQCLLKNDYNTCSSVSIEPQVQNSTMINVNSPPKRKLSVTEKRKTALALTNSLADLMTQSSENQFLSHLNTLRKLESIWKTGMEASIEKIVAPDYFTETDGVLNISQEIETIDADDQRC